MNSKELFEAFSLVENAHLDLVDTLEKETFEMNCEKKHPIRRKSITFLIAAVICISVLATTALASGWIPGIFSAMKKIYPEDELLYNTAAEANTDAVAEVREVPQLDLTQFTLFERYYDGETILLGYDLSAIIPEPMVGYVPENNDWSAIKSGIEFSAIAWEKPQDWQNGSVTENSAEEGLSPQAASMDAMFHGMLSPEAYEEVWTILRKNGHVCVMTNEIWVGDHILINGHDIGEVLSEEVWSMRYDYEVEEGSCIKLNPLPQAGIDQEEVTVTLKIRSCETYYYMDTEGNATTSTGNHKTDTLDFVLHNVNK